MSEPGSLTHSRSSFEGRDVFIPKYHGKQLFGILRKYLGKVFSQLALRNKVK